MIVILSLAFRATFSVWRSQPHLQFGIQSHVFSLVFRAASPVWHSESLSLHSLAFKVIILSRSGIHRHFFSVQSYIPSVQSCQFRPSSLVFSVIIFFFSSTFKAISPVRCLDPPYLFQFIVQIHTFILAFRAVVCLSLTFRVIIFFSLTFRAIMHTHSDILSYHISSSLAFKVIFPHPYHSESQLIAFIFTGIAHLAFTILHSSSFSSPHYLALIACSSCSFGPPLPLHMTQSFEFMTHISVMLLGTLHLAFSCSSHKAIPFGHILSYTPRWFNCYSSLTLIFESLSETFQRVSESILQLQRHSESYPSLGILEPFLFLCWFG